MDQTSKAFGASVDSSAPSEIDIVDTFTRLIFHDGSTHDGLTHDGSVLAARDMMIVAALCEVDEAAETASGNDFPRHLGSYLRGLGVSEMIALVERVRDHFQDPLGELPRAQTRSPAWRGQPSRF